MRIAIAGSQGTGKTTLIETLRNHFQIQPVTRKTSRSILTDWNITLNDVHTDPKLAIKFQEEILNRKMADDTADNADNTVICTERTFTDLFVYATFAVGYNNEYNEWLNTYYDKCKTSNHLYDHVFLLTGGHFSVKQDGVRSINKHYSNMVNASFAAYMNKMIPSSRMHVIDVKDLSQRVDILMNIIDV